jgi:hypothetical protein
MGNSPEKTLPLSEFRLQQPQQAIQMQIMINNAVKLIKTDTIWLTDSPKSSKSSISQSSLQFTNFALIKINVSKRV